MSKSDSVGSRTSVCNVIQYILSDIWRMSPEIYGIYFVEVVLAVIQPMILTIAPKYLIDELLGSQNKQRILISVLIIILGFEGCNLIGNILKNVRSKRTDFIDREINILLSDKAMKMDYQYTEDPTVLDMVSQVKNSIGYAGGVLSILDTFKDMITGIILTVGTGVIFLNGSPLMLLIISLSIIFQMLLSGKINVIEREYYQKRASFDRSFGYILWQLSNFKYGKDLRLYHAKDLMLGKADYYNGELTNQMHEQSKAVTKVALGNVLVSVLQVAGIYLYLGIKVIRRVIGIGDFTMFISASENFLSGLQGAFSSFQKIYNKSFYLSKYVDFMNCGDLATDGTNVPNETKDHVIEFRNVYFRYPQTENYVLKNVSWKMSPKKHVAIVGMNGAGKTTMIKLLLRLYVPEKGEILLDGININEYSYKDYIKLFSAVFQDFKLFSFPLDENIAAEECVDDTKIESTLEQVGLYNKFSEMEDGFKTYIYKDFSEKGLEPSGGEQQKVAIARALYKDASIVILDEPTAALDPIAEMEVFSHFKELVKNKTAIFISHRLSACQFCDEIIVFKDGEIIENGTHAQLIRVENGEYKNMFQIQAEYYK